MNVSDSEIKLLCDNLALTREDLLETACAFRKHVEPEIAASYAVDYLGSLMINQSAEEQNKMLLHVIKFCVNMLTE